MKFNNLKFNKDEFKIDESIAYFIGVLHSDGCIYRFKDKKKNRVAIRLYLGIGKKSLPMAREFQKVLANSFGKNINIRYAASKNSFIMQTSINRMYSIFQQWENEKIPLVIRNNFRLFGSYLAGVIDGDGYVKYKKHKDGRIQCQIKISSAKPLKTLRRLIIHHLKCACHFEKDINKRGISYNTCFYISKKNHVFLRNFIVPYLTMPYKKNRIIEYILKTGLERFELSSTGDFRQDRSQWFYLPNAKSDQNQRF